MIDTRLALWKWPNEFAFRLITINPIGTTNNNEELTHINYYLISLQSHAQYNMPIAHICIEQQQVTSPYNFVKNNRSTDHEYYHEQAKLQCESTKTVSKPNGTHRRIRIYCQNKANNQAKH